MQQFSRGLFPISLSGNYSCNGSFQLIFVGQLKGKRRALLHFSVGPDMPAMSPDDVLNGAQSYPCSFELIGAVKALEDAKQFVSVPLVKTCAVISNADDRFTWRKWSDSVRSPYVPVDCCISMH